MVENSLQFGDQGICGPGRSEFRNESLNVKTIIIYLETFDTGFSYTANSVIKEAEEKGLNVRFESFNSLKKKIKNIRSTYISASKFAEDFNNSFSNTILSILLEAS